MGKKQKEKKEEASPPEATAVEPSEGPVPEPRQPKTVLYCAVCSFPPEYCEFGSRFTKCKEWLNDAHPDLFSQYYSEDALQSKLGTMTLAAQQKLEKDTAKKEAKADAKADAALKKKMSSQVTIKRIERNKRKHVTTVHGLEAFSIDLKKAAKQFASKFATGASVSKNPQGLDEIVVQGDVAYEIVEMLEEEVGLLKGVPADNIEVIEEKKKKAAAAE
ncbi:translation initiation factor SUI1 [Pterulicium gracile]|uniref:Translation machinery-associated protein 22 n=1 Tax=Pterulicium gracile TaxID=1884261 RepID=A0A5C3QTS6_9AGAR|nr:translation initiation factor SUI1 [Pterula gracilis]